MIYILFVKWKNFNSDFLNFDRRNLDLSMYDSYNEKNEKICMYIKKIIIK